MIINLLDLHPTKPTKKNGNQTQSRKIIMYSRNTISAYSPLSHKW